nr:MAG TPA: hypothetical protein [Caudoviricetes sp.]
MYHFPGYGLRYLLTYVLLIFFVLDSMFLGIEA